MKASNFKKVLIVTSDIPETAVNLLRQNFNTIVNFEHSRKAILEKVSGVNALFWSTPIKLDREVLNAAGPSLEMVGAMFAGVDHIDVEELKRRCIKLSNSVDVFNRSVADTAVLLTLAASRRLQESRLHLENNTSKSHLLLGQDLAGSTVGIVGLGGIGQAIVKRLQAFEVGDFVYCGPREKKEGKHMGAKQRLKKSALIGALKENTIFAAGLDVMSPEPLPNDHELLKLPNCVLLPHLRSVTLSTRTKMAELTAGNIIRALRGESLLTPILE